MKMLIKIMFTFMLLLSLLGCTKESNSPEDIGKAHFELYFDVLLGEEVDVDHECKEIYSVDFIEYCKNTMAEIEELPGYQVLTEDDYELYDVTVEEVDGDFKDLIGFEEYDVVYEVTISYGMNLIAGDDSSLLEEDYTLYVVQIEGNYKAVLRTND